MKNVTSVNVYYNGFDRKTDNEIEKALGVEFWASGCEVGTGLRDLAFRVENQSQAVSLKEKAFGIKDVHKVTFTDEDGYTVEQFNR